MKLRHGLGSDQSIPVIAEFLNEASYKREAGDTKPCRQRDGAD